MGRRSRVQRLLLGPLTCCGAVCGSDAVSWLCCFSCFYVFARRARWTARDCLGVLLDANRRAGQQPFLVTTLPWLAPMTTGLLPVLFIKQMTRYAASAQIHGSFAVCTAGAKSRSAQGGGRDPAGRLLADGVLQHRNGVPGLGTLPPAVAERPESRTVQGGGSDLTRHLLPAPGRGQLPY